MPTCWTSSIGATVSLESDTRDGEEEPVDVMEPRGEELLAGEALPGDVSNKVTPEP